MWKRQIRGMKKCCLHYGVGAALKRKWKDIPHHQGDARRHCSQATAGCVAGSWIIGLRGAERASQLWLCFGVRENCSTSLCFPSL